MIKLFLFIWGKIPKKYQSLKNHGLFNSHGVQ